MDTTRFDLGAEIKRLFKDYLGTRSTTNTPSEREAERFLEDWFRGQPYFGHYRDRWGLHPVENDPLDRHVVWGLVKGSGADTVVLIHHYDVVDADEYADIRASAHESDRINDALGRRTALLDAESVTDLKSEQWQFGRGSADMKAGGAIQLALLKAYSQCAHVSGNLLLLCLPDEENLSAGMRSAAGLLYRLKEDHGLNYALMIDSEPHQRIDHRQGIIHRGSVGKLLPIVYVRGHLAHVGRVFEGFNPLLLMSAVVADTELNTAFCDRLNGEVAPPPTWMMLKDRKIHYDVSIPIAIAGCLNVITFDTRPADVLARLTVIAENAFERVLAAMNRSHRAYLAQTGQRAGTLPWRVRVKTYAQLYGQAVADGHEDFRDSHQLLGDRIQAQIQAGDKNMIEGSFDLIEHCFESVADKAPTVVIGLAPPYYPGVCSHEFNRGRNTAETAAAAVCDLARNRWQQPYNSQNYFTGISDLSYCAWNADPQQMATIQGNMPLWGGLYTIPFDTIRAVAMPCINIGPWGKDLHKVGERVFKQDLYERTPHLMNCAIQSVLENCCPRPGGQW